ncbi:MAG: SH3 domain-containing protein [Thermodesulfobacteriota bacterium]|jgi:SH3-like domain-containing protein
MSNRQYRLASQAFAPLLISLVLSLAAASVAGAAEYASVARNGANIRSGPGADYEILWEVGKGYPLAILQQQDRWAQVVDFEGARGWIVTLLLSDQKTVIVKGKDINLRVGPGVNYEPVAVVKYGVIFTPLEREGEWVKVRHADGTVGWLHDSLLWPARLQP